jgi:hypothetical protein
MVTFKEFLAELLDRTVKPTQVKKTKTEREYTLNADGNEITFYATKYSPRTDKWEVHFMGIDHRGLESWKANGKGGELKIFAAMKWVIDELIKDMKPEFIAFEAEKDIGENETKRIDLYRKFMKRFANDDYELSEREVDDGEAIDFLLTRKK